LNPQIFPLFLRLDETRGTDTHPIIALVFSPLNFTKFYGNRKEAYPFITKPYSLESAVNSPTRFGEDPKNIENTKTNFLPIVTVSLLTKNKKLLVIIKTRF